jgi:hypothetical protein
MRSKILLFVATTLFVCVPTIYSQDTSSGQAKTAAFRPQNIEFPTVEGWNLGEKQAIPMEQSGIVVNYDSDLKERMTVYVYSRGEIDKSNGLSGVVKDEFEGAKDALKTVADAGIYTNLKTVKSETAFVGGASGKVKALRALLSFEARGMKLNSEIFVFPYKEHVVKLRVSRPATLDAVTASYSTLLAAIDGLFSK